MGSWYEQEQQKCIDQMSQDLYDSVWDAKPLNIWEQLESINLKEKTMSKKQKVFAIDESTLSRYISNKIYYAKPMTRGEYNKNRGWPIPSDENPDDDGYVILYPDGYVSWSPAPQFEATSVRTDQMNFGMALVALKKGFKVARKDGWNAKGMFLTVAYEQKDKTDFGILYNKGFPENGQDSAPYLENFICLFTVRKTLVPWQATQSDMLADDYFIVD